MKLIYTSSVPKLNGIAWKLYKENPMKANCRQKSFTFIVAVILLVLACSVPGVQTSAPPTIVPVVITATQPSLTQNVTVSETPTITPTPPDLGPIVNFGGGGTATPTSSPTPTPTLPDFDPIVNFGGGGANWGCEKYPANPNSILVSAVAGSELAILCVYLQNANVAASVKINLTQLGGAGIVLSSNDLILNWYRKSVYWEGFPIEGAIDAWADDNSIKFALPIWWPTTLPAGTWRFTVHQVGGMQASADFQVPKQNGQSYISAVDERSRRELMPAEPMNAFQYLQIDDNNKVDFAGSNYPSNTPVYILLYHLLRDEGKTEYELIEKKVVISDLSGSITGDLSGPFGLEQSYILYGVTNPNAVLGGTDTVTCNQALGPTFGLSCDHFGTLPSVNSARSEIDMKYTALGGGGGFLGKPAGIERGTTGGKGSFRDFQFGSIYWSPITGAYEVHGLIRDKWAQLGWEKSFLGYPTTDESTTPDGVGRYNHFQGGSIYWTPNTGAYEVHGRIRDKWAELGWEKSFLGYPTTDELTTPDGVGRYNHFQGGSIYWTPNTDAHEVHGLIRDKWAELGWEKSCLGYPISDEEPSSAGWARQSRFQHGIITWSPERGAQQTCY